MTSSERGALKVDVSLPTGATNAIAVLSANGVHYQDSAQEPHSYQYWTDVEDGLVSIDRVNAGEYRLTVFAVGERLMRNIFSGVNADFFS